MWPMRTFLEEFSERLWFPKRGDGLHRTVLKPEDIPELCFTYARRVFQHSLEHRFQLARRRTNDAQHIRRRGLLLQGFAQLVE